MSKIKVYMTEGWCTHRWSHTIEIDTLDYPELKGMSEEEAFEYLSENMWEFEIKDDNSKYKLTLADTLQEEWIREKVKGEEFDLHME